MRIVIASMCIPFAQHPGTGLVEQLRAQLVRRGYSAEVVLLPFIPDWRTLVEQTAAVRLLDLTESCGNRIDRLITVRYPSFALKHPNKVAWFTPAAAEGGWPDAATDPVARSHRDLMRRSDSAFLRECRWVFTTSWAAADRVRRFLRMEPHGILYPPLSPDHPFRPGPFGDYLLCDGWSPLVAEAVAAAEPGVRVVVTDDRPAGEVDGRVTFVGAVPTERKAELLAGSCGLVHVQSAADPTGTSVLEAFHAHKPVLTPRGGGGSAELVREGESGWVYPPVPSLLGAAMTRLWRERADGERMGRVGHATLAHAGIDWDTVVRGLLA